MKKSWDGIRSIINVTKKNTWKINKLHYQGKVIEYGVGMDNVINNFFMNIGSTVEAKITNVSKSFNSFLRY